MLLPVAAGFVAGILTQPLWASVPALLPLLFSLLAAVLAGTAARGRRRTAACLLAGVAAGLAWAALVAGLLLSSRLPAAAAGADYRVEVEVLAVRQHADGRAGWTVALRDLPWGGRCRLPFAACRLRLGSWHPLPLQPGERWQLQVRLQPPRAAQNPGVADFERFLFGERVVAIGYVRESADNRRLAPPVALAAWRARLLAASQPLAGSGAGDLATDEATRFARAVLPALVLDERSLLGSAQWRVLADTGTAHLVAISGLHVALLWGAVLWLLSLLRRRGVATLRHDRGAVLLALLVATGYAAVAGMPLPAQRAVVMLAVASLFLVAGGEVPGWRILLAAAVAVLLFDPLAVHAAGFWLSFGAVAILLLLHDLHRRRPSPAGWPLLRGPAALALLQARLSLLLAPVLLGLFGQASVSSVLANLPAIPLVNLLALPPGLLGFLLAPWAPALADPCLELATVALALLWQWLAWVDAIGWLRPATAHGIGTTPLLLLLAALPLLVFAGLALRLAALALALLAWPVPAAPPPGAADACVLDVGQGLAVSVRTATHALLYDTGPARGERDAGSAIVVPALRAQGVERLDLLVLSHADPDHAGGADAVIAALSPREIRVGDPRAGGGRGEPCDRELHWRFDGVAVALWPGAAAGDDNDRSCVLRVDAGGIALLVTGDSSRRRELALVAERGDGLRSHVLVAGNHGSRASSAETFLVRVAPQLLLYPTGPGRGPHPEVDARVRRLGIPALATADHGAVCVRLAPGQPLSPQGARGGQRRHWRP